MANANRLKFGLAGGALPATRVLVKPLDASKFAGKPSFCLMVIDEVHGTATGANVYGGNLGAGYDPSKYAQPLPAKGSDKWKQWSKKGYEEGNVADFDVLVDVSEMVETEVPTEADLKA